MRLTQIWTKEEADLLRKKWSIEKREEILAFFPNRTWHQLLHKANHMGLYRSSRLASYRNTDPIVLTLAESAYIAGIVDGEGWLGMSLTKERPGHKPQLIAYLAIINTSMPLLDFLCAKFQATTKSRKLTLGTKRKEVIQIRNYHKMADILTQITPYMIVKKPQAEIVLRFCNRRLNLPYRSPWTEEELKDFKELKELNQYTKNQMKSTGNTDYRLSLIFKQSQETSSQMVS